MAIEVIINLGKKIIGRQILSKQQITIGRGKYNDIILPDRVKNSRIAKIIYVTLIIKMSLFIFIL